MPDRYDDIARLAPDLAEALDAEERAALDAALADPEAAPALREALAHWAAARHRLAADLAGAMPRRPLLALYALSDDPLALTAEEEALLEAARPALDAALERHPGLAAVVARHRADRDAFLAMWDEEMARSAPAPRRAAPDRAARPAIRRATPSRVAWRSAVGVTFVLFIALAVFLLQRDAGFETVQTAVGETRALTLPDGSTVRLAEATRLEYRGRAVRLTGEAAFEVVPGPEPFVVETPTAITTVLGTTFGVRADGRQTEVVLASGAVALASRTAPADTVRLAPGQRSRVVAGAAPERPARAEVSESLAWTGTWYFQATPLAEIAGRLRAHYGVGIEVPAELSAERVTGAFEQGVPVEQTLRTLGTALGVGVEGDARSGFRFAPDVR
jgi:transmembrane sensor